MLQALEANLLLFLFLSRRRCRHTRCAIRFCLGPIFRPKIAVQILEELLLHEIEVVARLRHPPVVRLCIHSALWCPHPVLSATQRMRHFVAVVLRVLTRHGSEAC